MTLPVAELFRAGRRTYLPTVVLYGAHNPACLRVLFSNGFAMATRGSLVHFIPTVQIEIVPTRQFEASASVGAFFARTAVPGPQIID